MIDLEPTKGVVLVSEDNFYYRVFDYIHPEGGFIAYPLKRKIDDKFMNLEGGFLSRSFDFEKYFAGNVEMPFLRKEMVRQAFEPRQALIERSRTSSLLEGILGALVKIGIPQEDLGFDGSSVYRCTDENSDLDLLVFGEESSQLFLGSLDEFTDCARIERYSSNPKGLVERRRRHLGELTKKDKEYEIGKPVFWKGKKHINITPTFKVGDPFMDFTKSDWQLEGIETVSVRLLDTSLARQVPSVYFVECLDDTKKIDVVESDMFYHSLKGDPGDVVVVRGPVVRTTLNGKTSHRIVLNSWGNYLNFKFSFVGD